MCLSIVKEQYNLPLEEWRVGYKVVIQETDGVCRPVWMSGLYFQVGNIYTDSEYGKITNYYNRNIQYSTGYHIFTNLNDAHIYLAKINELFGDEGNYVIYSVEYNQTVCNGTEWEYVNRKKYTLDVDVARQIKFVAKIT
jgi:hypothetical protein